MTPFLSILLSITALQSSCCRQSFSYPVIADVTRIEVVADNSVKVKEINDPSRIDSIIRFIDDRRSRWCSPSFSVPAASATLNLHMSKGSQSRFGMGNGFLVDELSGSEYLLRISPDEQQALFKLLDIDEDHFFNK